MERPKQSDFKGPNRKVRMKKYQDALRKYRDFLAKEKRQKREERLKGMKDTGRGKRFLSSSELKKKKAKETQKETPKDSYAKDRVGKVNKESKAYKEAKRINESIPISSSKKKVNKTEGTRQPYVDPDAADKEAEKVFRSSSSVAKAKEKHSKEEKLKIGYRRTKGEGVDRKGGEGYRGDTRITAKLKKAGFTESRLAKLRKKHAEFKANRKKKKVKKS